MKQAIHAQVGNALWASMHSDSLATGSTVLNEVESSGATNQNFKPIDKHGFKLK